MMDVETSYSDFINCDRTGRRNAVPDIAGQGKAAASTSELSKDMAEMDLKAAGGEPGPSPAPGAEGSPGQDPQGGGGGVLRSAGDQRGAEKCKEKAGKSKNGSKVVVLSGQVNTFIHCQPVWSVGRSKCRLFIGSDCTKRKQNGVKLTSERMLFLLYTVFAIYTHEETRKHKNV
ncbi:cAMP-dependent protein kinase inhibitor gamma [Cololabis saira]|uniref:cAMP-dependent protein kinase inhibitor gamma n=1 Tax=Cololabis saira TaxID=129043 RepID=UPI002AD21359|nr:cAMP-dependent protein kinase inhibitor gamma [Cololabis saira]XP_061590663.1 cAMP-dependent protein kinase inhibitor gamma [Cololabis saira]